MLNQPFICSTNDIKDGSAKNFIHAEMHFFIVNKSGHFTAYINSCPHLKIPLEWQENDFICKDTDLLRCATHGALFLPESGLCVSGPCAGQRLKPVKIALKGEQIFLAAK